MAVCLRHLSRHCSPLLGTFVEDSPVSVIMAHIVRVISCLTFGEPCVPEPTTELIEYSVYWLSCVLSSTAIGTLV